MFRTVIKFQAVIILVLFIISAWFVFTYRILEVPPGINGDEAAIGLNAELVSKNGYDSNGKFLPLFTAAKGSKDWKQPITFYSEVLAFRLFGSSYFILRAVSVFFVLLGAGIIFLMLYELEGLMLAVAGLLIYVTTPIVMIQSHLALENIAPVPFIALWLWMIIKYMRSLKNKYLILAAVALSLSTYSYLGLRLIMPPLVVLTVSFIYYLNRRFPRRAIYRMLIFLLVVMPFLMIFPLVKKDYPGSFLGQYRAYEITSYQQLILPYISSFDPSFLFIHGDVTPYHSTGKQGMFLLATLPLFIAGIVKILQKRQSILIFTLISFFLMPILFGLGSDIHRASRLLSLIPPYVVISSLGIMALVNLRQKICRSVFILVLITLIIANFADFLKDYWYDYPGRIKSDFSKPYQLVFEKAYNLSITKNLTPYIQKDFRSQNWLAEDFFENIYFPNKLKFWGDDLPLPRDSVIIVPSYLLTRYKDLEKIKFDNEEFGLLVNH